MSDDRTARSAARAAGGVLLAVVLINVLLRVLPLPDVDLSSVSLPDLPAWLHTVLQVKNWILAGVVVVIVVAVAIEEVMKDRRAR